MGSLVSGIFGGGKGGGGTPPDYATGIQVAKDATDTGSQLGGAISRDAQSLYNDNVPIANQAVGNNLATAAQANATGQRLAGQGVNLIDAGKGAFDNGATIINSGAAAVNQGGNLINTGNNLTQTGAGALKDFVTNPALAATNTANTQALKDTTWADSRYLANRTAGFEQKQGADTALYTGGNSGIEAKFGGDINNDVGNAVADARTGQTQTTNANIRQMMRYGLSVPDSVAGLDVAQAQQTAGAATTARNSAIDKYRQLVGQGINLNNQTFQTGQGAMTGALGLGESALATGRANTLQDQATQIGNLTGLATLGNATTQAGTGVMGAGAGVINAGNGTMNAGTSMVNAGANVAGAGTSSMNAGTTASNSAVTNQLAPGAQLLNGINMGDQTTMGGRQLAIQGVGNVLNSQGQVYGANMNASTANANQGTDLFGSVLGSMGGLGKLFGATGGGGAGGVSGMLALA